MFAWDVKGVAALISSRSRSEKLGWFVTKLEPHSSVLLVGVSTTAGLGTNNLVEQGIADAVENAYAVVYDLEGHPGFPCVFVRGDARQLPFADQSFDYVVSNAVIEHVGGASEARAMVRESRRVARKAAFHTTPNRRFPIELHTQLPLIHWLPRSLQFFAFRLFGKAYLPHFVHLFTARTLGRLDGAVKIHRPNSMTLVGEWSSCDRAEQN